MTNDKQLNDELSDFADDLRSLSLSASVADRDQLMFRCGQATVVPQSGPKPEPTPGGWLRQALLVACSICLGAGLMHWVSGVPEPSADSLVRDNVDSRSNEMAPTSRLQEIYSADEIAAVRSGQVLCVSSNPNKLNSLAVASAPVGPFKASPTIRAGMVNRIRGMP